MLGLAQAPAEDPAALRAWATRYATAAYRERFNQLLEELR